MTFDEIFKTNDTGKYEIFKSDKNNQFYFRLKARNGEIILKSEGYTTKQNCFKGINAVKRFGLDTENFIIHKNSEYHFEITSNNNEVVGVGETYKNLNILLIGIYSVIRNSQTSIINEV